MLFRSDLHNITRTVSIFDLNFPHIINGKTGIRVLDLLFQIIQGKIDSAFKDCIALEELQFPSAVRIGSRAFFGCSSLQEVSFPNVRAVESSAYYGCTGLKSIILPAVDSIDDNAFWFCQSLSRLLLPPQPPVMGENIFIGASDQREVRICDETGDRKSVV